MFWLVPNEGMWGFVEYRCRVCALGDLGVLLIIVPVYLQLWIVGFVDYRFSVGARMDSRDSLTTALVCAQ